MELHNFTPPDFPLPPACTCAFATQLLPPIFLQAPETSWRLLITTPFETGKPYLAKISLL